MANYPVSSYITNAAFPPCLIYTVKGEFPTTKTHNVASSIILYSSAIYLLYREQDGPDVTSCIPTRFVIPLKTKRFWDPFGSNTKLVILDSASTLPKKLPTANMFELNRFQQTKLDFLKNKVFFLTKRHFVPSQPYIEKTLPQTLSAFDLSYLLNTFRNDLSIILGYKKKEIISDIRITGSHANEIVYNKASPPNDTDINIYLRYYPQNKSDISYLFLIIEQIVLDVLARKIVLSNYTHLDIIKIIKNYYLTNRKIVINNKNIWFLLGIGTLDLKFIIEAQRSYTAATYSTEVSLFFNKIFYTCLQYTGEEIKAFYEKKILKVPQPSEIQNGLCRILHELTRHKFCEINLFTEIFKGHIQEFDLSPEDGIKSIVLEIKSYFNRSTLPSKEKEEKLLILLESLLAFVKETAYEDSSIIQKYKKIYCTLIDFFFKTENNIITPDFIEKIYLFKAPHNLKKIIIKKAIFLLIMKNNLSIEEQYILIDIFNWLHKKQLFPEEQTLIYTEILKKLSISKHPKVHSHAQIIFNKIKDKLSDEQYLEIIKRYFHTYLNLKILSTNSYLLTTSHFLKSDRTDPSIILEKLKYFNRLNISNTAEKKIFSLLHHLKTDIEKKKYGIFIIENENLIFSLYKKTLSLPLPLKKLLYIAEDIVFFNNAENKIMLVKQLLNNIDENELIELNEKIELYNYIASNFDLSTTISRELSLQIISFSFAHNIKSIRDALLNTEDAKKEIIMNFLQKRDDFSSHEMGVDLLFENIESFDLDKIFIVFLLTFLTEYNHADNLITLFKDKFEILSQSKKIDEYTLEKLQTTFLFKITNTTNLDALSHYLSMFYKDKYIQSKKWNGVLSNIFQYLFAKNRIENTLKNTGLLKSLEKYKNHPKMPALKKYK